MNQGVITPEPPSIGHVPDYSREIVLTDYPEVGMPDAMENIIGNYADDVNELTDTQASYCGDCCPLIGACPFNHDPEQDYDCAEEIFKWYVENSNE